MATRIGGFRRGTRHKLKKYYKTQGKVNISKHLQTFKSGEKVTLKLEPSVHSGMYNPKFHGKHGVVAGKKGTYYEVEVKDGGKLKTVIVHPVHIVANGKTDNN